MLFLLWPNSICRAPSSVSTERNLSWGGFVDWQRYGEEGRQVCPNGRCRRHFAMLFRQDERDCLLRSSTTSSTGLQGRLDRVCSRRTGARGRGGLTRWYRPSKRLLRASRAGDQASGGRPGVRTPAYPWPLGIRLDDADGPTNAKAGGIRLVEGKARTDFAPYPSFALLSRMGVLRSPTRTILTTHPCSSPRPMAQLVLAGTLSIVNLHRSD